MSGHLLQLNRAWLGCGCPATEEAVCTHWVLHLSCQGVFVDSVKALLFILRGCCGNCQYGDMPSSNFMKLMHLW